MDIIELALEGTERLAAYIERNLILFKTHAKSSPSYINRMREKH